MCSGPLTSVCSHWLAFWLHLRERFSLPRRSVATAFTRWYTAFALRRSLQSVDVSWDGTIGRASRKGYSPALKATLLLWSVCEICSSPNGVNNCENSSISYRWDQSLCCRIDLPFGLVCSSHSSLHGSYLVDPASSHMLVSKIKPCMSKYKLLILWNCEWLIKSVIVYLMVQTTRITVVILELIRAKIPTSGRDVFIR